MDSSLFDCLDRIIVLSRHETQRLAVNLNPPSRIGQFEGKVPTDLLVELILPETYTEPLRAVSEVVAGKDWPERHRDALVN